MEVYLAQMELARPSTALSASRGPPRTEESLPRRLPVCAYVFKELKKEVKSNKALLDSLNEVSGALLELVPWRAREGLEKMVAEDNERYRLVSDTITQKVEEIDAAILRSQQVGPQYLVFWATDVLQLPRVFT